MALNDEIRTSEASSKRSMTTGHLLIVMPKLKWTAEMATVNRERGTIAFVIALSMLFI